MELPAADLDRAADVFVDELIGLRSGERVLIYRDEVDDPAVARSIGDRAQRRGAQVDLLGLKAHWPPAERTRRIGEAISRGFDAVCELSKETFYWSAWSREARAGARIYSLAGLGADAFVRCVAGVNHQSMYQRGLELMHALKGRRRVRIVTGRGTDIELEMALSPLRRIARRVWNRISDASAPPPPFVGTPTGLLNRGTECTFLGGQLSFLGAAHSIEGTAVIDGYAWPPDDAGRLRAPLTLEIRQGLVDGIGVESSGGEAFRRWVERGSRRVQHFCIGFNPGATLDGNLLEAERVSGCVTVGIGEGLEHTDAVMQGATLFADGERVVGEEGPWA